MAFASDSSADTSLFGVACPAAAASETGSASVFDISHGSSSEGSKHFRGRPPAGWVPGLKGIEQGKGTGRSGSRSVSAAPPVNRPGSNGPRARADSPAPGMYGPARSGANPVRWRSESQDTHGDPDGSAAKRRIVQDGDDNVVAEQSLPVSWSTHGDGDGHAVAGPVFHGEPFPPVNLPNGTAQYFNLSDGDGYGNGGGDEGMQSGSEVGPDFDMEINAGLAQVNVQNIQGDQIHNTQVNIMNNPNAADAIAAAAQQSQQAASDAAQATMMTAEARHSAIQAEERSRANDEVNEYKVRIIQMEAERVKALSGAKDEVVQLLAQHADLAKRQQLDMERMKLQFEAQVKGKDDDLHRVQTELQGSQQNVVRLRGVEVQYQGLVSAHSDKEKEVRELKEQLRSATAEPSFHGQESNEEKAVKEAARKCINFEKERAEKHKQESARLRKEMEALRKGMSVGAANADPGNNRDHSRQSNGSGHATAGGGSQYQRHSSQNGGDGVPFQGNKKGNSSGPAAAGGGSDPPPPPNGNEDKKGSGSASAGRTPSWDDKKKKPSSGTAAADNNPPTNSNSGARGGYGDPSVGSANAANGGGSQAGAYSSPPPVRLSLMEEMMNKMKELEAKYLKEKETTAQLQDQMQAQYREAQAASYRHEQQRRRAAMSPQYPRMNDGYWDEDDDGWRDDDDEDYHRGNVFGGVKDPVPDGVCRAVAALWKKASVHHPRTGREGERVKMPNFFPDSGTITQWKTELCIAATSASGRTDQLVTEWMSLADNIKEVPYHDLKYVPRALVTLDRKVTSGVIGMCKGEFGLFIARENESLIATERRALTATELLRKIYKHLAVNAEMSSVFSIQDLSELQVGSQDTLYAFRNRFMEIVRKMDDQVADSTLCSMLVEKLKVAGLMEVERSLWRMKLMDDPTRNLQWWMSALDAHINSLNEEKNAKDRNRRFNQQNDKSNRGRMFPAADNGGGNAIADGSGKKGHDQNKQDGGKKKGKGKGKKGGDRDKSAGASRGNTTPRGGKAGNDGGTNKGKGKGGGKSKDTVDEAEKAIRAKRDSDQKSPCVFQHTPEGCRKSASECPFSHSIPLTDAEKKVAQKMANKLSARARSRSNSRGRQGKSDEICYAFQQTGRCAFGDSCRFKHE